MRTFVSGSSLLLLHAASAFTVCNVGMRSTRNIMEDTSLADTPKKIEIDVSDLGLTMEDFNAPLPRELLQRLETSGYESTSKIPSVQDDACLWTETPDKITVTLKIPGLRGQPSLCLSHMTSTNTLSVAAFGQVVWSCLMKGKVKPDTVVFQANDGSDMVPVIEYQVEKADPNERWGGFILQIGEDSIL